MTKHQFTITIETADTGKAMQVYERCTAAVQDLIDTDHPGFRIDCGVLWPTDTPNDQCVVEAARDLHLDEGTIEVDYGAGVSYSSDGGAYVDARVWVSDEAIKAAGGVNPETADEDDESEDAPADSEGGHCD